MKLKFLLIGLAVGVTMLPLGGVYASDTKTIVKAENKGDFTAVINAIHQQMAPGGRFEFVDKHERTTIDAKFGDMMTLFDKYGTTAQMDRNTKIQLLQDQEDINAILTHRDGRRLVCKSERPIGSLIPQRTCRTYAEIQRYREEGQRYIRREGSQRNPVSGKPGLVVPGSH